MSDICDTIDTETATRKKVNVKEPSMFKVIYMNDDTTTVEFVIQSLVQIFDFSMEAAVALTEEIHSEGSGVAGIYPHEIAEQKGIEVTKAARKQGYPLLVKLEPAS